MEEKEKERETDRNARKITGASIREGRGRGEWRTESELQQRVSLADSRFSENEDASERGER